MTIKQARYIFFTEYYHDLPLEQKLDKIAVNEQYTYFLDSLCKNGQITQNQYNNANNFIPR